MAGRTPQYQSGYMVQLDALRAFAALAVMVFHFWPTIFFHQLSLGPLGVRLFFVLSGFLITGILLNCRRIINETGQSTGFTLRQFYIRRSLRIFPVYYFVLIVAWFAGNPEVRDDFLWYASYSSNFLFALKGEWATSTSHFWSLAVEEQFYLFWPVMVLFCPRRFFLGLMIGMILSGPTYRLLGYWMAPNSIAMFTIPFASCDALGLGALMAFVSDNPVLRKRIMKVGFFMMIAVPIWEVIGLKKDFQGFDHVVMGTVRAVAMVWLVGRASQGFGGFIGRILEFKPIIYLGKISYGVYVYHFFIPLVVPPFLLYLGVPYPENIGVQFVLYFLATLIAAMASWHFFERPINSLKNRFDYIGKGLSQRGFNRKSSNTPKEVDSVCS